MAGKERSTPPADDTAEQFRAKLCEEFLPLIERLETLGTLTSPSGFYLDHGQVRNAKRLLEDLKDVVQWGRIEHRLPPPPPSPVELLEYARAMAVHSDPECRKVGAAFVESVAAAAAADERFQRLLGSAMPWAHTLPPGRARADVARAQRSPSPRPRKPRATRAPREAQ